MQHTLRFSPLAAVLSAFALLILLPHSAHAAQVTVVMTDNQFTQQSISINPGDTVTWVNQGSMAHTVTADSGQFDSGAIQPGQQFSVTLNQSGVYNYHCAYHGGVNGAGMSGIVTVSGGSVPAPTYVNPNINYNPVIAPPPAPVSTIAQLTAQVQSLIAQINALQAQGGLSGGTTPAAGSNSSSCPLIGRVLKLGSSGDDVTRLQQFLARDPSVYPEGIVSGYYGALTQAAVQRWQTKYNIVSSGTPETTGFGVAGPRTAAAISLLCTTGSYGGVSAGGTGAPVGGFIQVTPITGAAPLSVNVTATVNTGGSCSGSVYTLTFGDGTAQVQIPTSSGNCSQQSQTFQHTYTYGGTYQVVLSAGSHTTNTTVTVSGPSAPVGPVGGARGTISAFTTSGNAPLTVTFYVSCAAGTAYNVVFGDGADLGSTAVSGTKCGQGGLDAVSHTFTQAGTYQVQLVIFSQQSNGTVTPTVAATVTISVGSVSASYSYNPPQLSSSIASTSTPSTLQFDLPTGCTGYDLSWGDGTAHVIQADGGTTCSQSSTVVTLSHTYTHTGTFTITLKRGPSLARVDTVGVTIQ